MPFDGGYALRFSRSRALRAPASVRPVEYLSALEQQGQRGYELLLARHDGSLALAAYEYAAHKNRALGLHRCPTSRDLRVAARTIEGRIAWLGGLVPKARVLAAECVAAGLPVLP